MASKDEADLQRDSNFPPTPPPRSLVISLYFPTTPSKTETGFEDIWRGLWNFPSHLWAQPNCWKLLEFWYNKYAVKLELVLERYVFWSFPHPHVPLNLYQRRISVQPCSRPIVHQSPGPLLIRSCSTNGPWSSAHIYCSDSPHPGCLPSSSLGSGLLTLPAGGREEEETVDVLTPERKTQQWVLTWVRACRVESWGFKRCNTSSVDFKVFSLWRSTNDACCCWRILNRSLKQTAKKKVSKKYIKLLLMLII